jgi:hypothetical protein
MGVAMVRSTFAAVPRGWAHNRAGRNTRPGADQRPAADTVGPPRSRELDRPPRFARPMPDTCIPLRCRSENRLSR